MKILTQFTLITLLFTAACTDPETAGPTDGNGGTIEKGIVSGKVTDSNGNAVKNAEIVANSTDYLSKTSHGYTDASGNYRIKLPNGIAEGSYFTTGTVTVKYHNKNFTMPLYEENTQVFSAYDGAVRNFVFKLSGKRSATDNDETKPLGATLEVHHDFNNIDPANLELVLEPQGPLLDGSTGKRIVTKMPRNDYRIRDIPMGNYKITARDLESGEVYGIAIHDSGKDYARSVTSLFSPADFDASGFYELVILVGKL